MTRRKLIGDGFTLMEILIVISIIITLSSVASVRVNSARIKSRDAKRVATLKTIEEALYLYFNEHGYFPIGESEVLINGVCGQDPFLIIQNNPSILENIGTTGNPIQGIKDTSAETSEPWLPQLGPKIYPGAPNHKGFFCASVGSELLPSWWIKDPRNSGIYRFVYTVKKDLSAFELSIPLENNNSLMQNDGGNRNDRYELGNGKDVIYSS